MTLDKYPDDFEFITAMQQAKARAEDFQRHQDAVADRETGYGNRHQHGDGRKGDAALQRRLQSRTALDLLMQDVSYAALHTDLTTLLSQAENLIQEAIQKADTALQEAQNQLSETLDTANTLPDGTKVFRAEDGGVFTADGRLVGEEEAAAIEWRGGASSYEEFLKHKQAAEDAQLRLEELRRYQIEVLGRVRDMLGDETKPPSKADMKQAIDDIEKGLNSVELHREANRANETSVELQAASKINLPDLGA